MHTRKCIRQHMQSDDSNTGLSYYMFIFNSQVTPGAVTIVEVKIELANLRNDSMPFSLKLGAHSGMRLSTLYIILCYFRAPVSITYKVA